MFLFGWADLNQMPAGRPSGALAFGLPIQTTTVLDRNKEGPPNVGKAGALPPPQKWRGAHAQAPGLHRLVRGAGVDLGD